ncbi:hypothetical protein SDRG_05189 [Saprolegnia diclina VS20]|uniref:Uncharacterized protein n=1 Tax=Saprolegnia diclina (strain VS20) TaxID=1156394 RepID=T0RYE7_SAPDV|nr:hypothetical protein SDRG_05189 [Saprolegnia diclina VS20]EQC37593.1 hypothetical protein SDRG_05189 [Saprolegnia diclina VS20]|eukprot:XP_008609113.1 hypothetical protein SDRG_05189 [Saprolegnia diclina VS20]
MPKETTVVALPTAQHLVTSALASSFFSHGDPEYEPARRDQMRQSCKRVRTWRAAVVNPLLQHKTRPESGVGKKTKERRVHIAVLLSSILEAYETCVVHYAETIGKESFAEYYANAILQRSTSRKHGLELLQATIASLVHTTTHPRIRCFANLVGVTDPFNPKEKTTLFLRVIERMYRLKTNDAAKGLATYDDIASVACVVFHSIGFGQAAARRVVRDLFHEPDPYWTFEYLAPTCAELQVERGWPAGAEADLLEQVSRLSSSMRNANGTRKVDGDAFLELILGAWNHQAQQLYLDLDRACNMEEATLAAAIDATRQQCYDRANIPPATADEEAIFHQLLSRHWLADVDLNGVGHAWHRPLRDVQRLYASYRETQAAHSGKKPWDWEAWRWEADWDWGGLIAAVHHVDENAPVLHASPLPLTNDSGILDLAECMLGDRNMQKMGQFLQLPTRKLHTLRVRGNDVRDKGCEAIVHAVHSSQPSVLELDLSDNAIGAIGARALRDVLSSKTCRLQVLCLDNNKLGNLVGKALMEDIASSNRSLRTLSLRRNELSCGHAVAHLLRVHPTIKRLDLSWNIFRGLHIVPMAAALTDNGTLNELVLSYNAAGDMGFAALTKALGTNKVLRHLDVGHNNVLAILDMKQLLKALSHHASLETLVLCGNPLGCSVVATLEKDTAGSRVHVHMSGCSHLSSSTYQLPGAQ